MGNCQNFSDDDNKKSTIRLKARPQIMIKSFTWSRDSHGLFDYECKNVNKRQIKISSSGKLMRSGNDVIWIKSSDNPTHVNTNDKDLIQLHIKDGIFLMGSCYQNKSPKSEKNNNRNKIEENPENLDDNIWIVVKTVNQNPHNKGLKLLEGDFIKLGRAKFKIKEIKASPYELPSKINDKNTEIAAKELTSNQLIDTKTNHTNKDLDLSRSGKMCRICLFETSEPDDPFLSPCSCSGTMEYIHIRCLQKWIKSKIQTKTHGSCTSIYWKSLECELCKKPYPSSFNVSGKKIDLIEIQRPECAYIMLEILSKEKNMSRGIHLIKMETKTNIRLGRGHDSDIRITDISVSRCHALIKLEQGNFYIEDNNSKFGTLVYAKKPIPLVGEFANCQVQIGRTLIGFSWKKDWKIFPNCFGLPKTQPDSNSDIEINNNNDSGDEIYVEQSNNHQNNEFHIHNHAGDAAEELDIGIEEEGDDENNNGPPPPSPDILR